MIGAVFHCASAPTSSNEEKCHAAEPVAPTSSVAAAVKSKLKSSDRAVRLVSTLEDVLSPSQTELVDAAGLGRQ